jgi:lysophospholipid acyltransferase 5
MELETKLTRKFAPLTAKWNKNPVTKFILHAYCYLYTTSALFYALTAFTLLRIGPIIQAYNSIYWIGHVIVAVGLIFQGFIPKFKDPASKESLKKTE